MLLVPRLLSSPSLSHIHDYTHSGLKWVVAVLMTDTMAAKTSSSNSTFLITECSSAKPKRTHTQHTAKTMGEMVRSCRHDWSASPVTTAVVSNLSCRSATHQRTSKAPEQEQSDRGYRELSRTLCTVLRLGNNGKQGQLI